MNKILFITVLLLATSAFAEDANNEWQNTTLSDATIKKIQDAQYQYKKCVSGEMQKTAHQEQESRRATEEIMRQCETILSQMREVYLTEKVPGTIADRHLRQMRMQTTRNVLQGMMFGETSRKSGQQQ